MFQPIIHNSYPWNNFVGVDGTLILRGTDDEDEFVEDGEEITGIDFCKVIYSLYILDNQHCDHFGYEFQKYLKIKSNFNLQ